MSAETLRQIAAGIATKSEIVDRDMVVNDLLEAADDLEHSKAVAEERWKDAAQLYLRSAGPNGKGAFEFNMHATIMPLIAEHLAETFRGLGGENYVQIEVNHDELGPLVLTMQRRLGELPATIAARERARADAAEAKLAAIGAG